MDLYIHHLSILVIKILSSKLISSALIHPLYHIYNTMGPTRQFFYFSYPPSHPLSLHIISPAPGGGNGKADGTWPKDLARPASRGGPHAGVTADLAPRAVGRRPSPLSPRRARGGPPLSLPGERARGRRARAGASSPPRGTAPSRRHSSTTARRWRTDALLCSGPPSLLCARRRHGP
jgi:hypothetical protein